LAELADMSVEGLTPEEIEVAKLAGQVYLRFKELPQAHPADLGELAFHVLRDRADRLRPGSDPRPPGQLDVQVAAVLVQESRA
jgi:hypothetical protein